MTTSLETFLVDIFRDRGFTLSPRRENPIISRRGTYNFTRGLELSEKSRLDFKYHVLSGSVKGLLHLGPNVIDALATKGQVTQRVVIGNLDLTYSGDRIECQPPEDHPFPEGFAHLVRGLNSNPNHSMLEHSTTPFLIPILGIITAYLNCYRSL